MLDAHELRAPVPLIRPAAGSVWLHVENVVN
jgi:hypothetical protein